MLESRSSDQRNAARVLPEPVGATTSACSPLLIADQAPSWAGVGASNAPVNQARVASENRSRVDMSASVPGRYDTSRVESTRRPGYELDVEDRFDGDELDRGLWLPHYLPHWSSRAAAAARYRLGDGCLRLLVEEDQPPWCPDLDGEVRVS